MGFVLLRGFVTFLPQSEAQDLPAQAQPVVKPAPAPGVGNFAALFVHEYLSYRPGDNGERIVRLERFLAPGIERGAGLDTTGAPRPQTVTQAWPWSVTEEGEGRWSVVVVAQVQDSGEGKDAPLPRYLALRIPVAETQGRYAVTTYPAFVPLPLDRPGPDVAWQPPGAPVSDPDPAVRDLVIGFLKAYTGGTPAEIRYYLLPGVEMDGLGGQFTFRELAGLEVRQEGERLWVVAEARFADPVSGTAYRQHLVFELAKQERWYIKDMMQEGGAAK